MFIKICGITNLADARLAVTTGADALGFIFAPSRRKIEPKAAARIVAELPERVEKVGVFLNASLDEIFQTAEIAKLTCLQLHGGENQALCDALGKSYKVIKSIKITPEGEILTSRIPGVWKLLTDTYLPQASGGTGQTFDWRCLQQFDPHEIIVAGGLNAENIDQLLDHIEPFGVDVASGVESSPGQKDPAKLQAFFDRIHAREAREFFKHGLDR
jgi:phosphoribosylanthranilate isomerase